MILPTMTLTELSAELLADYREVAARWKAFEPKFERIRKRVPAFPWLWETKVMTKRRNEWYIGCYAFSKKDATVVYPHISIFFRRENATWAAYPIRGKDSTLLLIFSSHFFERYIERFLNVDKKDLEYPVKDIVRVFFLRNYHIFPYKSEIEDRVRGFCEDGMFLGDWLDDGVGLVKTYLSRDEMKPNQFTEFIQAVQSWILGDIFMSHKGRSLVDEDFDGLPDTYFSTDVQIGFVNSRNNAIWESIFIDLLKFKQEHEEEYLQCSRMLDSIIENRRK